MAHFAKINDLGVVEDVIVLDNSLLLDDNGDEVESLGIAFLELSPGGTEGLWVQTSYNNNFRAVYASIGGTYDSSSDSFRHSKPYPSWVWGEEDASWIAPIAAIIPSEDVFGFETESITWDEDTVSWIVVATPWVHYAKYNIDESYEGTTVSMPRSYILDDSENEDDELGIILSLDYKGPGIWRRVTTPPTP